MYFCSAVNSRFYYNDYKRHVGDKMKIENLPLDELTNQTYNDWKSRQHVKRQEDSYREHIASNNLARIVDEALKQLRGKNDYK